MTQKTWSAVDAYIEDKLIPADPVLESALAASTEAGLPPIAVSPSLGKLLMILAQGIGAKRILEIGTLGGYSTTWLARGLAADGRLITLEADPKHAKVARKNLENAGLGGSVEIRLGKALDTLPELAAEGEAPFDLIFLDANKDDYPGYLDWAVKLARPGSLIVADNVVREGKVADPDSTDPNVRGVQTMYERIAAYPKLSATSIQTVGGRGYDGFLIAIVQPANN